MTDNVIDIRPDTFLRELSTGTGIMEAGTKAGIEHDELVKMFEDNPKFALTAREIIIDRVEDHLRADHEDSLAVLQSIRDRRPEDDKA